MSTASNQTQKTVFAAIKSAKENSMYSPFSELKTRAKNIWLTWKLEDYTPIQLTVTKYDSTTGEMEVMDDHLETVTSLSTHDLWVIWGDDYLEEAIGAFEGECIGTIISNISQTHPEELAVACSYALQHKYLVDVFEHNYDHVLHFYKRASAS